MLYKSTRGGGDRVSAGRALLAGLAEDGGLFVPEAIPAVDKPLDMLIKMPYPSLAYEILKLYLTDYSEEELRFAVDKAYGSNFDDPRIAPLVQADGVCFLELFHGRTLAFKDMALSLLPYLLKIAAKKYLNNKHILILTATSGDTGKAALEAFADVPNMSVAVYYPENGVSATQKKQMVTQEGENVYVFGVQGNFDDAQTGVKRLFEDRLLSESLEKQGVLLSSANSINIGRLLPQIVYYFYAYGQLVAGGTIKTGDEVDFTVPTGNFGNILAGYYARKMGLPIHRLICASNQNKILQDFFQTGEYDANRPLMVSISPSMDILVSSNLERLLYHVTGDTKKVSTLMDSLAKEKRYALEVKLPEFYAGYATEEETREAIRAMAKRGYVMDPHTAVGYHVWRQYASKTEHSPNIILSTASPYKFVEDVCGALGLPPDTGELEQFSGVPMPENLRILAQKETRHNYVCRVEDMKALLCKHVIFPQGR